MTQIHEPPLYNLQQTGYKGGFAPFYKADNFEWVKEVEQNWHIVEAEFKKQVGFKTYNAPHVKGEDGWKGLQLLNFGWKHHGNCSKFPKTMQLLQKVPNLTFVAFSILEPGAALQPHFGDTNTIIRAHLGIEIPAPAPECALQVSDITCGWEEGKIILFSECYLHSAWNKSSKRRIILCFDTMREPYIKAKLWICARVMAAQTLSFLNNVSGNFNWLIKLFQVPLYWSATFAWYLYLPVQQRISFLP